MYHLWTEAGLGGIRAKDGHGQVCTCTWTTAVFFHTSGYWNLTYIWPTYGLCMEFLIMHEGHRKVSARTIGMTCLLRKPVHYLFTADGETQHWYYNSKSLFLEDWFADWNICVLAAIASYQKNYKHKMISSIDYHKILDPRITVCNMSWCRPSGYYTGHILHSQLSSVSWF